MSQSNEQSSQSLFQPSEAESVTFGSFLLFVLSAIFVFGGFYLMSIAFSVADHWGIAAFAGGLAADAFGLWLAFGLIPGIANRRR